MKTAIVMEASRGIGRSIAERLAEDGFAVVVQFSGLAQEAMETVAGIIESGGLAIAMEADAAQDEEVKRLFENSLRELGRIDVVVAGAGTLALAPIARGDMESFDETIRTDLRATFLVCSQAAIHLGEGGRIIAFSSHAAGSAPPSCGAHVASKAGIEGLVRVLAKEVHEHRVTVNAIAFGASATQHLLLAKQGEPAVSSGEIPLSDVIRETRDILHLVSFLAGPDAGWVSGQVIPVTEGLGNGENFLRTGAGSFPAPGEAASWDLIAAHPH